MKPIPAPPLILIPAQLRFRFLMILLHPVATMGILDQHGQRGVRREVTPEILPVPVLAAPGALPNQPADVPSALAIHSPAAQGEKFGPPPAFGAFAPRDRLPVLERLRRQRLIGPEHGAGLPTAERHTEIGPHCDHVTFLAGFQAVEEMGIVPIIGITGDARVPHPTGIGLIQQRQGNLGFGLKGNSLRNMRLLAPRGVLRPRLRQIQPRRHRPGPRALGVMTIHRDLTVG